MNRLLTALIEAALLCTMVHGQSVVFVEPCDQSFQQLAFSGNIDYYVPFVASQPGQPGNCETVGRYCALYLVMKCRDAKGVAYELPNAVATDCGFLPTFGTCLPTNTTRCPTSLADEMLDNFSISQVGFQIAYGPTSQCAKPESIPSVCPGGSSPFVSLTAQCMDEIPSLAGDSAAIAVLSAIALLCSVCVVSSFITLGERGKEWWARVCREEQSASNYNESLSLISGKDAALNSDGSDLQPTATLFPPVIVRYAKWFCLLTNFGLLLEVRSRNFSNINTLFFEGLRSLSMLLVIAGHAYYWPLVTVGFSNNNQALDFFRRYTSITLYPAELAVDVFFFLSGFLFMHLYMKQIEKRHTKTLQKETAEMTENLFAEPLTIPETLVMYFRRWLRIVPVVMIVIFSAEYLLRHLPTGPLNQTYRTLSVFTDCRSNWWKQMLFIANYFDRDGCLGWFWYLNCDFQLFVIGGAIAWLYYKLARLSAWAWWLMMLSLLATAIGLSTHYQPIFGSGMHYMKTYARAAPYIYGVMAAVLVRHAPIRRFASRFRFRLAMYFVALCCLVSCINVMWYNDPIISRTGAAYHRFGSFLLSFAWGLGWLLVCLAWCPGHGGFFCRLLSHPIFIVISKLTFCSYVLHIIIISIDLGNQPHQFSFSLQLYYMRIGGYVVWTFIAATVLHMVVELPFANINDALTRRG